MSPFLRNLLIALAVGTSLTVGIITIQPNWDSKVIAACIIYAVVTSIFLGAQLVGFLMGHVSYSEQIESAKFQMLLEEEQEWN